MSETENKAVNTVKVLYDTMKKAGAGNVHFAIHNPFKDPTASAVIAVYDGEQPHHLVFEKLCDWLEEEGKQDVLDKIDELLGDLTFLNEGNLKREEQ